MWMSCSILMIHDLDMVLSFDPGPVEDVQAAGVPVLSPTIDIANARIQFQSGCVANLTASRVSTNKMRRLRLFQRDNYVSIDFQTRQGMICRREAGTGTRPSIGIEQLQGGEEEPLKLQLESFLTVVCDRRQAGGIRRRRSGGIGPRPPGFTGD